MGFTPVHSYNPATPNCEIKGIAPKSVVAGLEWLEPLPPGTTVYYLKKGDTLYWLSRQYFVSWTEISAINRIRNPHRLEVNTKIYIPPVNYTCSILQEYDLNPKDSRESLCAIYHLEPWQWLRLNPGYGSSVNRVPAGDPENAIGKTVFLPRYPLPAGRQSLTSYVWHSHFQIARPVSGRISSRFGYRWGRMHSGVDLAAPAGTPVKAALSGKVVFAGWRGAYGLLVIINHGRIRTYYGHLSVISVTEGQTVSQGSLVGLVGSTGRAYGSHLHFEVEQNGQKIDPLKYFPPPIDSLH